VSAPPSNKVGLRYAGKASAGGGSGPFSWSVAGGALPSGVSLDPASGALRGIPTASGSFSAELAVKDESSQTATVPVDIRVAPRISITTARLPRAVAGQLYRARLMSGGGLAPRRWTVAGGSLPRGVRLDGRAGVLSGTPRRAGSYRLRVRISDRLGGAATAALRLVVG
jgi:large repetitive protein